MSQSRVTEPTIAEAQAALDALLAEKRALGVEQTALKARLSVVERRLHELCGGSAREIEYAKTALLRAEANALWDAAPVVMVMESGRATEYRLASLTPKQIRLYTRRGFYETLVFSRADGRRMSQTIQNLDEVLALGEKQGKRG